MKNLYNRQKHLFACYHQDFSDEIAHRTHGDQIIIADADLTHRLTSVLRFAIGEQLILFDRSVRAIVTIAAVAKHKSITCVIDEKYINQVWQPAMNFVLPLLKKESLETALYSLSELGMTRIYLVTTQKSQQKWTPKEHERAQKIIIAAAEQSKNFAFPELMQPIDLKQASQKISDAHKVFFDPAGKPIAQQAREYANAQSLALAIGPEGDLSPEEKELLKESGFTFIALTPTVLRSSQAAALGAGIMRSLIR